MKILVTGGLGFIGSHTVVELQNDGFEVVIIDNLSNSSVEVLDGIVAISGVKPQFERLDLKVKDDVKSFFKNHSVDRGNGKKNNSNKLDNHCNYCLINTTILVLILFVVIFSSIFIHTLFKEAIRKIEDP